MTNQRKLSHDILNMIERLRIMHDLAKDKNFEAISKEELQQDLKEALEKLKQDFEQLLQ